MAVMNQTLRQSMRFGCLIAILTSVCIAAIFAEDSADKPHLLKTKSLSNVVRVHREIISGGVPDGADSFSELKELGIKTILSVDAMKPDIALAREYGMRYVHLPHGYDGIPASRVLEIAKAFRDLPKPIFIHCHHGRHRSPTAAATGCVAVGMINPTDAMAVLKLAGTNVGYKGLYDCVSKAQKLNLAELDSTSVDFLEVAPIPPLTEAMVSIDAIFAKLTFANKQGWPTNESHSSNALLLVEHYVEIVRSEDQTMHPPEFFGLLKEGAIHVSTLERLIREELDATESNRLKIGKAIQRVESNCSACHARFRDMPKAP
jgi:protein tyrosine phosphatase (PTP) superfamily phosphohydrolase (DUF442 family)